MLRLETLLYRRFCKVIALSFVEGGTLLAIRYWLLVVSCVDAYKISTFHLPCSQESFDSRQRIGRFYEGVTLTKLLK